jgi:hypothetical protein
VGATDLIGYAAAVLVLAAFCMRRMVTLRLVAIASNLVFIAYALRAGLEPVLLLHALLLPMNALRLVQAHFLESRPCLPSRPPPAPTAKPRSAS